MMWNWLVSGLAAGAALVLFEGTPLSAHSPFLLFKMVEMIGVTVFGTSAKYLATLEEKLSVGSPGELWWRCGGTLRRNHEPLERVVSLPEERHRISISRSAVQLEKLAHRALDGFHSDAAQFRLCLRPHQERRHAR